MAENEGTITQVVETPTQAVTPAQTQAVTQSDSQAETESISLEEAKKLRREAQSLRGKLAKLEEAEQQRKDAELTEAQKLQKRVAELEADKAKHEHADLQRQAAEKVGLNPKLASRLVGDTLEDLEADAQAILAELPKAPKAQIGATNPGTNATGQGETDDQRRARIYGQGMNIFNSKVASEKGGGVYFNTKTESE